MQIGGRHLGGQWLRFVSTDGMARSAPGSGWWARGFGFGGKLCIHPAQLEPVNAGFAPADRETAWARSVINIGDAAVQIDGQMVDRPVWSRPSASRALAEGQIVTDDRLFDLDRATPGVWLGSARLS